MKLKNISIENYRFFKEAQLFDFESKNILLYGENGSGKTSLYNALIDFFFYYKNESDSKKKLRDNKNIFSNSDPKIEVLFDNGTTISFTKDGFNKYDLKLDIEQISKSKLFLTYQDIFALNNIFKKDISYKEFKDIFTILYFDELNDKFNDFDDTLQELQDILYDNINEIKDSFEIIEKTINDFSHKYEHELEPIKKKDPDNKYDVIDNIYDTTFYLSSNYISQLEQCREDLQIFLNVFSSKYIGFVETFDILDKFDTIKEEIIQRTKDNDRYEQQELSQEIIIIDKEEIENGEIDDLIETIKIHCDFSQEYLKCESLSKDINQIINNKLASSIDKINDILKFLEINIEVKKVKEKPYIKFNVDNIFDWKSRQARSIDFEVYLSGEKLDDHWRNLNEAKLSALNFSIYLSSVLGKKPAIPILVLDDLLISLDMSNRNKMINLLLDRSGKFFDDKYQIMIFTHDKAFFEMSKYKIELKDKSHWKYFEMYSDTKGNHEKPFVIENSKTYFEKAKYYLNNHDYSASANYLRKEIERVLDLYLKIDKLSEKISLSEMKQKQIIELKGLQKISNKIDKIEKEIKESNYPHKLKSIKSTLEASKKQTKKCINDCAKIRSTIKHILNPQSHDDINKPLYKKELEDAIKMVQHLKDKMDI